MVRRQQGPGRIPAMTETPRRGTRRSPGRWRGAAVCLTVAAGLLVGCADSPEVPAGPDGEAAPVLLSGRDIYGGSCASCHGTSGGGGNGPRLDDGRMVAAYPDIADMNLVVAEGLGSQMPGFGGALTQQEIEAVNRYIREVL